MAMRHLEPHRSARIGWLRAAVLGANDGIVSTASLIVGVAAAHATHASILITGIAGLVAGAMSMAAGEYVSVHSQADTEKADLATESAELVKDPEAERRELAAIYVGRGLDRTLARRVADELMAHDALGAHARDELGISDTMAARPVQAALASAVSFALGAAAPLLVVLLARGRGWGWGAGCRPPRCCFSRYWASCLRARAVHPCWRARCASPSGVRWPWPSRQVRAPLLVSLHEGSRYTRL